MKYRKKPVVIDAHLFRGNDDGVVGLCKWLASVNAPQDVLAICVGSPHHHLKITTLEGVMIANDGDYVIRGIHGEFYPCKAPIFAATYEATADATENAPRSLAEQMARVGAQRGADATGEPHAVRFNDAEGCWESFPVQCVARPKAE